MTKSFLARLDPNNSFTDYKGLLFKEFIDGVKPNESYDQVAMDKMTQNLKNIFGWSVTVPFQKLSSQKCMDMLVLASKYPD